MTLDPVLLGNLFSTLSGIAAAFIAALWISLVLWVYRDIKTRSKDTTIRILAPILVTLLFLPGFVIYLILRPDKTLEESFQNALEEETLLHTLTEIEHCHQCNRQIKSDWVFCPYCHTKLKKTCLRCDKLMELAWDLGPYCGVSSLQELNNTTVFNRSSHNTPSNPNNMDC